MDYLIPNKHVCTCFREIPHIKSNSSSFRCLNSTSGKETRSISTAKKPKLKMSVLDSIQSAFDMGDIKLCYMLLESGNENILRKRERERETISHSKLENCLLLN